MAAAVRNPQRDLETPGGHLFPYNPNPRTVTWERLELMRLRRLGLNNRYSRHFTSLHSSRNNDCKDTFGFSSNSGSSTERNLGEAATGKSNDTPRKVNSFAPFATLGKPTCGYYFTTGTENRKMKFGIPPSDLVKWRNYVPQH